MKLVARVFCLLMILGACSYKAYAQTPVDPFVNINYDPPPGCIDLTPGPPDGMTASLTETYPFTGCIDNTSATTAITTFNLTLDDIPNSTVLGVQSNVFVDATFKFLGAGGPPSTYDELFSFSGTGPCLISDPGGQMCFGLAPTTDPTHNSASVFDTPSLVAFPEPPSVILFATGLILFLISITCLPRKAKLV